MFCKEKEDPIRRLKSELQSADAIVIGAGAGLSTSAGFTYSAERFEKHFSDFREKYGITDTYAGVQLHNACAEIMHRQGHPEPAGQAKITPAFNLPSHYVIHTVGPVVDGPLTDRHRDLLAGCYRSCLKLADENGLESIALCCISTGEFHFPNEEAAIIALREVRQYRKNGGRCNVIFNVFGDKDRAIYDRLLKRGSSG